MKKKTRTNKNCIWRVAALALFVTALLAVLRLQLSFVQDTVASEPVLLTASPSVPKPKIAFLFLARNRLPLDFYWEHFFKGAKEHEYTVYVHARPGFVYTKETTQGESFYNRQLPNSVLVEWGEASMIQAERLLLLKALEDSQNERFILLSDSCVPLYNFSYVYEYVMSTTKSFVDSFRDYRENRYNPRMSPVIPREKWRKGSQWFVLTRKHATAVATDDKIVSVFAEHCKRGALPEFWREYKLTGYKASGKNCVPDEHYVQTVLAIKGYESELERRSLTYSLWKRSNRVRERQGWHPFTFSDVSLETIREIQAIDNIKYESEWRTEWCSVNNAPRPCFLFARKFTKGAGIKLMNMTREWDLTTQQVQSI